MKHLNIKKALAAWQELQPLSEKDRERIAFRTPNYTSILNAMRTQPTLTMVNESTALTEGNSNCRLKKKHYLFGDLGKMDYLCTRI